MPRKGKVISNEAKLTTYEKSLFNYHVRGNWNAKSGTYTPKVSERNIYQGSSVKLAKMYRPMSLFRTTVRDRQTGVVTNLKTKVTTKSGLTLKINRVSGTGYNMKGRVSLNESFRGMRGTTRVNTGYRTEIRTSNNWIATPSNGQPVKLKPQSVQIGTQKLDGKLNTVFVKDPLSTIAMQLKIAAYNLQKSIDYWKNALAYRALNIFQSSFDMGRFNSDGSKPWKKNAKSTIAKRIYRNTWPGAGGLMLETGYLRDTLKVKDGAGLKPAVVSSTARYAGIHNNPDGLVYANGTPVTQRQFIGHSSNINLFILQYQTQYLFDSVFLAQV